MQTLGEFFFGKTLRFHMIGSKDMTDFAQNFFHRMLHFVKKIVKSLFLIILMGYQTNITVF